MPRPMNNNSYELRTQIPNNNNFNSITPNNYNIVDNKTTPPMAPKAPSPTTINMEHNQQLPPPHHQQQQQQPHQRRSRSRRHDLSSANGSGGSSRHMTSDGVSQPSATRQQQRRRPTNYTARAPDHTELLGASSNNAPPRTKTNRRSSSLDRSENEEDQERRRHLKSGGQLPSSSEYQQQPESAAADVIGGLSQQVQQRREQLQLQAMQAQLRLEREQAQQQQKLLAEQQLHQQQQQRRGSSNRDRGSSIKSGVSSGRRSSQEVSDPNRPPISSPSSNSKSSSKSSSRDRERRSSQERKQSRRGSKTDSAPDPADTSERTEQRRIEEYAGKRALLRLEQELADHSESNNRMASQHSRTNSLSSGNLTDTESPGGNNTGQQQQHYKSVMDRKKLARVPQVKKSDLIIGEYLGRGNFCDVFEVTWILSEKNSKSSRSLTYEDSDNEESMKDSDETLKSMQDSMESFELSCSNDLNLVGNGSGGPSGLTRQASRRSVSQVVGTRMGSLMGDGSSSARGFGGSGRLRNPNVLALKCLRPAVRAQPRKFVIGAEDLAHETALLACLDHPNIIQLYGRAEGCFSTAFQMRSSKSSSKSGSKGGDNRGGKQMSNEGYFIILDRLMTTLTDRNEEWKDECRAINGVGPPPEGRPLPPESTLREHLCKRLKVAYCIADALEYLHSRHVVFRDLKPANVGFDCNDCVKMFDFGFATSIAPLLSQPYEGYGPLTETCGTRRYMATEVALKLGYGKEVDVYSFGMLLWEICALDKPFDSIQSVDEFHDLVVLCGRRPSLNIDPLWTPSLKSLMSRCWSTDPLDRPTMVQVKSLLCNVLRDMNKAMEKSGGRLTGTEGGDGDQEAGGTRVTPQQRAEQGGNFIHKWRRRVSI